MKLHGEQAEIAVGASIHYSGDRLVSVGRLNIIPSGALGLLAQPVICFGWA